ncbi:MAG: hypothetical protein ACI9EW_003969 [Cellvibrionaceae bacterium]|jgi:hypothetical protein
MSSKRPVRMPGYNIEEMDGELLIFHPSTTHIFHTNQTGAIIWGLCNGEKTVEEMIQLLSAAYPQSVDAISADCSEILKTFENQKMIRWT